MPARPLGQPVLFVETRAPLVTDDQSTGARAGYRWLRETTGEWWVCRSPALGAAIWDYEPRPGAGPFNAVRPLDLGSAAFADAEALSGAFFVAQNSAITLTAADHGKVFLATSGAPTITLPRASQIGPFFRCWFKARGTTITLAAAAGDLVDGAASVSITTGLSRAVGKSGATAMETY